MTPTLEERLEQVEQAMGASDGDRYMAELMHAALAALREKDARIKELEEAGARLWDALAAQPVRRVAAKHGGVLVKTAAVVGRSMTAALSPELDDQ